MSVTCDEWHPLISRYCDGELPRDDRRRLENHLETCVSCRKMLEKFKPAAAAARQGVDPSVRQREKMIGAIAGRIGAEERVARSSWFERRRMSFALPLLAAAAMLFVALWQFERTKVHELRSQIVVRPPKAGVLPASDATLLNRLSESYGSAPDWLGLHDGDVSVGLPTESVSRGVSVFGRDEYVHLAIDLSPEAGIGASPLSIRLLLKPGVESAGVYKLSEGRRVKFVCTARQSSNGGAIVDIRLTILAPRADGGSEQASLSTMLSLAAGITERGGAVPVGGVLHFVDVTMGERVTVSPERLNL